MARKRFTPAEKALISSNSPVEWQNVTQWHPASITSTEIITDNGWQYVPGTCEATTKTISKGTVIYISPGHIRAAA